MKTHSFKVTSRVHYVAPKLRTPAAAAGPGAEPKLPGKLKMARNFVKAVFQEALAIAKRKSKPDESLEAQREKICRGCLWYRKSDQRCAKCGCPAKKKVAWRSQKCPIGKW